MAAAKKARKTKKIIFLLIAILCIAVLLIALSTLFLPSKVEEVKEKKILDKTLEELKTIAKESPLIKNYAKIEPSYIKLSEQDIQSSVSAGLLPPNISSEIYRVDYIIPRFATGISLIIDLENRKILKTQNIVGIGA